MIIRDVTFNADNWQDGVVSVRYRELKDGTIKFAYRGEKWVLSPVMTTAEEPALFGGEYDLLESKLYRANRTVTEFPTVQMMKFRKDTQWTATDDDYINGINITHENRVIAACQILGNII
tara:strand:- start:322 stop:681 length:360 start_codon:yes stop_codon:yes gene_type:complete